MMLLLSFRALAADLELELTSPTGVPVNVVLADVSTGPLPSVTVPAGDDTPAHRFGFGLEQREDGSYRLDIRIEEVKALGSGRERYMLVAAPTVSFHAGEGSRVKHARRYADGSEAVIYAVQAQIVE